MVMGSADEKNRERCSGYNSQILWQKKEAGVFDMILYEEWGVKEGWAMK